jgi:hypothetical protein
VTGRAGGGTKVMPRLRNVFITWVTGGSFGLAGGRGGHGDSFTCLNAAGICAITVGAHSACILGVVMGLAGMRASLGDACAGVGLAVGMRTRWGALANSFVVGSDKGAWLGGRGSEVLFPLGSAPSPRLSSSFSPCSTTLASTPSVWL